MKRILMILSLLIAIPSCAQEKRYRVDSEEFCVPSAEIIKEPSWLPSDTPRGSGFAFNGCSETQDVVRPECAGRQWLVSGVVGAPADYPGWKWEDGYKGAYYWEAIHDPNSKVEISKAGDRLVVVTPGKMATYLVWNKATPLKGNKAPSLERGDELMAVCERQSKQSQSNDFICSRFTRAKGISISYSFATLTILDIDYSLHDSEVNSFIDAWRCRL